MLERATQKRTSDIVLSCHQSLVFKVDPACSRQRIGKSTCAQRARLVPGALAHTTGSSLPADLEAGAATRAFARAAAKDVTGGHKFDPKRTVALVVRGVAGLAQRIQAVLLRTRSRGSE